MKSSVFNTSEDSRNWPKSSEWTKIMQKEVMRSRGILTISKVTSKANRKETSEVFVYYSVTPIERANHFTLALDTFPSRVPT